MLVSVVIEVEHFIQSVCKSYELVLISLIL